VDAAAFIRRGLKELGSADDILLHLDGVIKP
jgi:hypothetical protein